MKFKIIVNNLNKDSDVKSLKLKSDDYDVKIFYYGDYEKDKANNKCKAGNLSMSCKPITDVFQISLVNGKVSLNIPANTMLTWDSVDDFKLQLDKSKAAAVELEEIVKEYFGI